MVGENGGGAFLLLYLVFAILIGVPLLSIELSLGRKSRKSPIAGMKVLTGSRRSPWNLIGWLGVGTMALIAAYYVMLMTWIVAYAGMSGMGRSFGSNPTETADAFAAFTSRPVPQLLISLGLVTFLVALIRGGLQSGLERLAKVAMPLLVVMLLGLAAWSASLPGAGAGFAWYLTPRFEVVDAGVVLAALGQAFYSIGIGMGAAFAFGSYLAPTESDIPGSAVLVVGVDTAMAILAGLVIFPALFSMGMAPDEGPSLLFVTMAAVFEQMPGGGLFGFLFFALMTVAALTSIVASYELFTSVGQDSLGLSRKQAATAAGISTWLATSVVILSQGPWSSIQIAGLDLFTFIDRLSGTYMLTAGAFLMSLYVVFRWGWHRFRDETNQGSGRITVGITWRPFVMFLIPLAVGTVLLLGLGVL